MIAITVTTVPASAIITVTVLLQNTSPESFSQKAKGGTGRFPLLPVLCVVSEAR
jgi:hypothetical protein